MREVFSHVDEINQLITVDPQSKTCLICSKDGLFSLMNVEKATKLLIENVGCGLLSCAFNGLKNMVFVSTQLYEAYGYLIATAKTPFKAFTLTGHTAAVNEILCFQQNVITGSADGYVHLYKLPDQVPTTLQVLKPAKKVHEHDGFITAMAMHESTLVTAGSDHKLVIY